MREERFSESNMDEEKEEGVTFVCLCHTGLKHGEKREVKVER